MNAPLSWDEFRLVKAIADTRSLVGAAEALGLNHSTIFRRLGSVEKALGARLFERSRSGYQPTAAGEEMVALATGMSDQVVEFERRVAGRDVKPSGELRITTVDSMAVYLLPPILTRFRQLNPGVHLDVILASHALNLSRRDADVAIRATNEPQETLVGRRIGAIRWAIYSSPKLALEYGAKTVEEAPWVAFGDNLGSPIGRRWTERNISQRRQVFRVNSVLSMAETIAAGAGAGVLPCFIGNSRADLTRIGAPIEELDVGLWILTHPDLRHSARVRAFTEHVGGELVKLRKALEGA
ncbi:LysR family transcriptional regulator [Methylocapsa sp. S129]|uniref:LysR family transcriptional regulator n=1 Tax=Methylocapsa sp. S129 TaxID=1641869 RepID=UPI00131CC543|nr:LysR family transcriptional regulator [Methylocapsa sp. S129]